MRSLFNEFIKNQIENTLKNMELECIENILGFKINELKEVYFKDIYDIDFIAFFNSPINVDRKIFVGRLSCKIYEDTAYSIKIKMEDGFDKDEFAKLLYRKAKTYFKKNNIINIKNIEGFPTL